MDIGTQANPVNVRMMVADKTTREMIVMAAATILPVAIVLLMQKPALRQAIVMRTWHYSKAFCARNADLWRDLETWCAQQYNIARI